VQLTKILSEVPLFSGLNEEQLSYITPYIKRRTYAERDVIVRRFEKGDALFILISGKVKVVSGDEMDETIIGVMRAGDFFGELSILDNEGRSADVVSLETTEVLILSSEDFFTCVHTVPEVGISLLKELAGRLRRSTSWIRALSSQDVYGRIAQQLLYLAENHGTTLDNGHIQIGLRLTQNDIASLVGASRESVNKAMGYFKSKEYIMVDSSYHVTIKDKVALEKRCR
jgi:CRP/FNR family transcriptional regulator, cyclic AMP receptor protein